MSTKSQRELFRIFKRIATTAFIAFGAVIATTYGWRSPANQGSYFKDQPALAQKLAAHVRVLSQHIGTRNYAHYENLQKAADYVKEEFEARGYKIQEQAYTIDGTTYKNIIVKTGESPTGEYIVVGAHYDSCFNPGADDNASGVAGLLELARMLKAEHLETPVMLAAFVNEEPPFFMTDNMGSLVFAKKLSQEGIKVKGAIILEMLGFYSDQRFSQKYPPLFGPFYPNQANFIALVGNFKSKKLVDFIHRDFTKNEYFPMEAVASPEFVPGVNFSDHWSFWQLGYPAVMVTDTAYLRSKHYHQMSDTAETLDYEKMAKVIFGLNRTIAALAQQ